MENATTQKQPAGESNIDDLARPIFETMIQVHGNKPSFRTVHADGAKDERELAYFPTNLTDGIEVLDDSMPDLRSRVYLPASNQRQKNNGKA